MIYNTNLLYKLKALKASKYADVNLELTKFKVEMVDKNMISYYNNTVFGNLLFTGVIFMSYILGEKIMRLRQSKGYSQEEFGAKLGVSRQAVSKWETGQTTPDVDKIILMSKLFEVSTDYLLKDENTEQSTSDFSAQVRNESSIRIHLNGKWHFERKSKKTLFGLPLYHINIGTGLYKAKGIFSVGMISTGIFALGLISIGLLAFGVLAIGLLALGSFALGGISVGAISIGALAVGGVAIGVFAIGGLAVGIYSLGGCAIASQIAFGGYAQGYIAIGDVASGEHAWEINNYIPPEVKSQIYNTIIDELPHTPEFIVNFFR